VEKCYEVILVTSFDDVIMMTLLNDVITDFFKFDFVIISLKKHNLAKLRNFRLSRWMILFMG